METIDYKQKIKDYMNSSEVDTLYKSMLNNLFPELRESEDERISKEIIDYLSTVDDKNLIPYESWIAYLEKQSEQKPFDYENNANKVEPKFKINDWIIYDRHISKVKDMDSEGYLVEDTYGDEGVLPKEFAEKHYRLWTIQDAKDGDVLAEDSCIFILKEVVNFSAAITYCTLFDDGEFHNGETLYFDIDSTKPATKEQRDKLEKAMLDAGYTFDFEKKELKKIEQSPIDVRTTGYWHVEDVEQKSAEWSEEDESHIRYLIECLEHCKKGVSLTMTTSTSQEYINWLKSLRPQNRWKPSDEQIIELRRVISGCSYDIEPLVELETKLKEL